MPSGRGTLTLVPELPEVETIRRQLDPLLAGAVIVDAWTFPSAKFTPGTEAVGSRMCGVRRRGKYLLVDLASAGTHSEPAGRESPDRELIIHLGMTGRLWVDPGNTEGTPHMRARWMLDDGRLLRFDDVRRFGRIAVVSSGDHAALPTLARMGPEPLGDDFSAEHLRYQVNRSSSALKTQLLSQRVVAGVGNIYADEALWRAGVHPESRQLTRAAARRLRDALRSVLAEGIANGGTTLRDYRDANGDAGDNQNFLDCYGRSGLPCHRCGNPLERTIIDSRSTVFCGKCQHKRA